MTINEETGLMVLDFDKEEVAAKDMHKAKFLATWQTLVDHVGINRETTTAEEPTIDKSWDGKRVDKRRAARVIFNDGSWASVVLHQVQETE